MWNVGLYFQSFIQLQVHWRVLYPTLQIRPQRGAVCPEEFSKLDINTTNMRYIFPNTKTVTLFIEHTHEFFQRGQASYAVLIVALLFLLLLEIYTLSQLNPSPNIYTNDWVRDSVIP